MSYPLEYLIILILFFTVGQLGYNYLRTRSINKELLVNQAILDTMTKSLYAHIILNLGKDEGEKMVNKALVTAKSVMKKEYGIVLNDLKITRDKKEEGQEKP